MALMRLHAAGCTSCQAHAAPAPCAAPPPCAPQAALDSQRELLGIFLGLPTGNITLSCSLLARRRLAAQHHLGSGTTGRRALQQQVRWICMRASVVGVLLNYKMKSPSAASCPLLYACQAPSTSLLPTLCPLLPAAPPTGRCRLLAQAGAAGALCAEPQHQHRPHDGKGGGLHPRAAHARLCAARPAPAAGRVLCVCDHSGTRNTGL